MSKAHQNSIIPAHELVQMIDDNTAELWHYDISPNGVKGTKPIDDIYDDSLICWLEMQNQNNAGTHVIDKSRYGNHGKILGPTEINGRNGKALSFDAFNDYIEIPHSPAFDISSVTIEFLIKPLFNTLTSRHRLITKGVLSWCVIDLFKNKTEIYIGGQLCTVSALPANEWAHLVATARIGENITIYINGSVVYDVPYTGTIVVGGYNIRIAASGLGIVRFEGTIDKMRIYNRALSAEEVSNRYNQSIYTLVSDGKYGSAIAVEEDSTNLTTSPDDGTILGCPYIPSQKYHSYNSGYNVKEWSVSSTVAAGKTFTYSLWMRSTSEIKSTYLMSVYDGTGGDGGWWHSEAGTLTNQWTRYFFTLSNMTGTITAIQVCRQNQLGTIEVAGPQIEEKNFATSFINGSRERGLINYPNPLQGLSQGTISCWAKKSPLNTDGGTLLCIDDSTSTNNSLAIDFYSNYMKFFIFDNTGTPRIVTANVTTDINWHMYTVTFDGSKVVGYIDGIAYGPASYATAFTSNGTLKLCQRGAPGYLDKWGNFLIDELRIDKVARTADEIRAWYLSDVPFYPRGNERVVL